MGRRGGIARREYAAVGRLAHHSDADRHRDRQPALPEGKRGGVSMRCVARAGSDRGAGIDALGVGLTLA